MASTCPLLRRFHVYQPEESLMNERRRLERVSGLLLRNLPRRQFFEFFIDERQKFLGRLRPAPFDGRQESSNLSHGTIDSTDD
jgi:hypothetical protein